MLYIAEDQAMVKIIFLQIVLYDYWMSTVYTECKYGGPLGRPGNSSVEARLVSPQRGFSLFVLIVDHTASGANVCTIVSRF